MSAPPVEKRSRRHGKSKDVSAESDVPVGDVEKPRKSKKAKGDRLSEEQSQDSLDATHEPETSRKEKKHKKRKHLEGEDVPDIRADADEPKKRKKRKHEHATTGEESEPAVLAEIDAKDAADEEVDGERKKRKRARKVEAEEEGKDAGRRRKAVCGNEAGVEVDPAAKTEASPKKDKKDKKKRKESNKHLGDEVMIIDPSSKHKKKRKHHSSSEFPNPSEDESLSEQAQKALQYAFTQFDDPSNWKFNKARQNWLIRNVWSDEAIPETYTPLVLRYLQGVQGGVREALVKSCREATNPPKPSESESKISESTQQADAGGQAESPTRRTVKFAVDAENSSQTVAPLHEGKRQRATILLAILTSNTP